MGCDKTISKIPTLFSLLGKTYRGNTLHQFSRSVRRFTILTSKPPIPMRTCGEEKRVTSVLTLPMSPFVCAGVSPLKISPAPLKTAWRREMVWAFSRPMRLEEMP